jgi:hypothetical protein
MQRLATLTALFAPDALAVPTMSVDIATMAAR